MATLGYTLASLLALAWLGITIRALFADRARGRRRCPRCFYNIDPALGLRCAECGHAAQSEGHLARTRRHWRTALLATLLLLIPAFTAGAITRLSQTGGWSAVPSPIATRLLWTDSDAIREGVIRRVRSAKIGHADGERIVRYAVRELQRTAADREVAFELLDALARNSFVQTGDPPGTLRPMLEELRPDLSVPVLVAIAKGNDAPQAAKAIDLLSHLRDADEDANQTILTAMASSDTTIAGAAWTAFERQWRASPTVRRLPAPPTDSTPQGPLARGTVVHRAFGARVLAFGDDRAALVNWLKVVSRDGRAAGRPEGTEGLENVWRSLALWLYCRLTEFDDDAWSSVKTALDDGDPLTRRTAITQIAGFEWSGELEGILRSLLKEERHERHTVVRVIASYNASARSLIPDMLSYAGDTQRNGGSTSFVRDFRQIGGTDSELLSTLVSRFMALAYMNAAASSDGRNGTQVRPQSPSVVSWWIESMWLADLGLRDELGAYLVRELMQLDNRAMDFASSAVAYAVLSGDRTTATRFVLDLNPDLNKPLLVGSPQQTVLELLRRDLADLKLIEAYFVDTDDEMHRLGLANLLNTFIPAHKLDPFEPMLRRLAEDKDPAIAAAAQSGLAKKKK